MIVALRRSVAALAAVAVVTLIGVAASTAAASPGRVPATDYDDAIAEAEARKAELENEQNELDHALEDTSADLVEANARLRELNARLPEAQRELELAEERLRRAELELEIAERKLESAEAEDARIAAQIAIDTERLEELEALVAELARAAYRESGSSDTLELVFGSATSQDFVDEFTLQHTAARTQGNALAEMEQIAAANRNRGDRQAAVRLYAAALRELAAELVAEAEVARAIAEDRAAEIAALVAEAEEIKAFLEAEKARFLKEIEDKERELLETEFELVKLARQSIEAGLSFPEGDFQSPVTSIYVTSPFGYRIHPIYGVRIFHAGVDLRAYCGTPILATTWGIVIHAKLNGGHGNQVLLNHGVIDGNAYTSTYNHLSRFAVGPNDIVAPGDVVGYSGTTGSSTACHLHFEIQQNGKYQNPMNFI